MSDPVIKKEKGEEKAIVVNTLNIISVDRTSKDIRNWRDAHRSAEAIYHPNRTRLLDLYKDVDLDGHLTGIVQKRIDAVLNKHLYFEKQEEETTDLADKKPKDKKKKSNTGKVDEVDALIETAAFRDLVTLIMERKFWGLSGAEFIPGKDFKFIPIPRKHIKPKWRIISKEQTGEEGYSYDEMWNLWVLGDENDLGLFLKCAPYAIWKKGDMADWAQYVEIFGQPMRVVKYDANDLKTKEELQKMLNEAGSALTMLIPKQAEFTVEDGKTSNGTGELQERFKNACNSEMSIIILGNTETTTSSKSSGYAQSKEHGKQQLEITKSDLAYVANTLNDPKLINIFKSYGFPVTGGRFVFEKEADVDELSTKKDVDLAISGKVPIDDDYWYDTYGIPKPDNYDELKDQMESERLLKLIPPGAEPMNPGKPGQKPKPGQKKLTNLSGWRIIREKLADFFDPAP